MTTITNTYKRHSDTFPDKIAIKTSEETINFREWNELVCQTANWFQSVVSSNKYVGLFMPNGIPFLQTFLGAAKAGWIAMPLDSRWKETEITQRLDILQPSIVITTKNHVRKIQNIFQKVLVWEDCYKEIREMGVSEGDNHREDHPFYLGFTSGSTGEPKAFLRSHLSWINSFECTEFDFGVEEHDHILIPGSLIHSHFLYGAISTLFLGGTVYLLEKFSISQSISFLRRYPISVIYVVPTMLEALLKENGSIKKKIKVISSGAKWEEHTKKGILDRFDMFELYELYGASELSFVTVLTHQENKIMFNSVGKPCHNVDLQIRKPHNELAKTNEVGKIYVKSKLFFDGYIHKEEGTIQSIIDEDGWMTVDDMGYVNEEGYLYIVGREKNMILYGGMNIFPEEIEAVISTHPDVEAVAVIGVSHPYWGQIVTACIQGKTNRKELRKFCKATLASYKIPRAWHFIDIIPLTTSGKIARPFIQEIIEGEVNTNK